MASISTCFAATRLKSRSLNLPLKPSLSLRLSQFHSCFVSQTSLVSNSIPKIRYATGGYVTVVRAGLDVSAPRVRPGGIVESDKLSSDVRKRAMDAVDDCGGRVTIGEVASKAGLKLNEAQRDLQALAADTEGFLEVSDEGDVLYVFPKDYRSRLAGKSLRIKIEPWVEKAKMAAEYLIRVSFGTALIASIVLVYTTIIAIISKKKIAVEDVEADHMTRVLPFTSIQLTCFGTGIHIIIGEDEYEMMMAG